MIAYLISILIFTSGTEIQKDSFEGSIDLMYISQYDTTYFTYYVKQENVRVDKFDKQHKHIESILLNLTQNDIYVVSPSRKLYTQINYVPGDKTNDKKFEVIKTKNSRMISGQPCYQWRVRNAERNTEISYWVAKNRYSFFTTFVPRFNLVDKMYEFYEVIPDTEGYFPLFVEERTLLRADKSKIMVQKITNRVISKSYFDIPADYEKLIR